METSKYSITFEKVEYPKFMYHKSEGSKLVKSKAEKDALGSEWTESPTMEVKLKKKKE